MKLRLRLEYLSKPRYGRYLQSVGNDINKAKKLYHANVRLAQAFHPIISQFEVILRNSINNKLATYFSDDDWIINQKNGFMNDLSLAASHYYLKDCILKTEYSLKKQKIPVTSWNIIANQNFGFWISLFNAYHFSLLKGQLMYVFPNRPTNVKRTNICGELNKIRIFRNRINHCEPLCFKANSINCEEASDVLEIIYELLNWIGKDVAVFIQSFDNVKEKIDNIYNLAK